MLFCGLFFFFFFKLIFSKKSFRNTIRVSNSLDPDQARRFVQTVCKGYQQMTKVAASYLIDVPMGRLEFESCLFKFL